jgi:hypothetical protein
MMSGFDRDLTMHGKQQFAVTEKMISAFKIFIRSHLVFIAVLIFCAGEGKNVAGYKRRRQNHKRSRNALPAEMPSFQLIFTQ